MSLALEQFGYSPAEAQLPYPGRSCTVSKIGDDLLAIMECPVAHAPLVQAGDWLYSTDAETRRKYPIRDGIPIMLVEESQIATPQEHERILAEAGRTTANDQEEQAK